MKTASETSGTLMHQHLHYKGPREERERKDLRKISEKEIIAGKFQNMRKEIVNQVQESTESPRKGKPEEEHTETQ